MKTTNLITPMIFVSVIGFILSLIVLNVFGFEVGVIFSISLSAGFIVSAGVGIENVIILARKKTDDKFYK
jgi:FtsH-binding integral membrane protein